MVYTAIQNGKLDMEYLNKLERTIQGAMAQRRRLSSFHCQRGFKSP